MTSAVDLKSIVGVIFPIFITADISNMIGDFDCENIMLLLDYARIRIPISEDGT